MAYNTKNIIRDAAGAPVPQYYNPTADLYEALQGRNGANRVELYGPDGSPLIVTSGKLDVKATDAEAILTQIRGYVDGIEAALGEVQATPTAYTVLARLKDLADRLGEVSTSPTTNTMLARLKTMEGYLDGVESALGTTADAEATGNGSLIAIVKRLRTLVGQGIVTLNSAIGTTGLLMAGSDGTNARAIKTATDGTVLTQLTGSIETVNTTPVTGIKTVTAIAAEIFAGTSAKASRRKLIIKNEDPVLRFRVGPSSVTQQTGFPVEPGATVIFQFDPAVAVPIYAVSEGASLQVSVMEG